MLPRRWCSSLFVLVLLAAPALAGPIDGMWLAKYQDRNGVTREVWFHLITAKDKLTGRVRLNNMDFDIQKGKVEGERAVSFQVVLLYDPGYKPDTLVFTGKLAGETLELVRSIQGKEGTSQKLVAQRSSGKP